MKNNESKNCDKLEIIIKKMLYVYWLNIQKSHLNFKIILMDEKNGYRKKKILCTCNTLK